MRQNIPPKITNVITTFVNAGYEIYLIGGSVRNMLLKKEVKDWDFTTNATPEQMLELYPTAFYDNTFGTVGIPIKENATDTTTENEKKTIVVEITTYRTEAGYSNQRHPDSVTWGTSLTEDLSRRDFTINAIALDCSTEKGEILDPFHGQADLEKRLIRAVGDPNLRFKEDALRLMRAVRIATQLGFSIEDTTLAAIVEDAPLLKNIAQERIREELMKILSSDYPYEGIMLLRNTGLLTYILPELQEGIGISQERPGRHHKDDVFTHNVLSLKFCPSDDPIVRFATLIHDVGKPRVASTDAEGYVIFHNHEVEGAKMAAHIADRLRFSKKDKEKVTTLIRWHMFTVDEHITDSAVRRFIRRIGPENVEDMMNLRIGDRLGGGTQRAESWRLKLFKKRVEEQLAPMPFGVNDLAINGNDIMQELGIKPSRKIGELLQTLFEEVDEDLEKNNREYLLRRVREISV